MAIKYLAIPTVLLLAIPGAHKKENERLTSTYTRGSHFVIVGETALPCMESTISACKPQPCVAYNMCRDSTT